MGWKGRGESSGLKLNHRLIFQITALGFMMLASGISGFGGTALLPSDIPDAITQTLPSETRPQDTTEINKSITVEEYVRNYFSDIPVMVEIARCESHFRQYDSNGDILRGEENKLDRGVMQINERYHIETSKKLGYDIHTLEGNTAYARDLFEKFGVRPWKSSSSCWGRTAAYSQYEDLALR